jgi:hypothetical protein
MSLYIASDFSDTFEAAPTFFTEFQAKRDSTVILMFAVLFSIFLAYVCIGLIRQYCPTKKNKIFDDQLAEKTREVLHLQFSP